MPPSTFPIISTGSSSLEWDGLTRTMSPPLRMQQTVSFVKYRKSITASHFSESEEFIGHEAIVMYFPSCCQLFRWKTSPEISEPQLLRTMQLVLL